jgi:hypothetical protein
MKESHRRRRVAEPTGRLMWGRVGAMTMTQSNPQWRPIEECIVTIEY